MVQERRWSPRAKAAEGEVPIRPLALLLLLVSLFRALSFRTPKHRANCHARDRAKGQRVCRVPTDRRDRGSHKTGHHGRKTMAPNTGPASVDGRS